MRRFVWVQCHGSHLPHCDETVLHGQGHPFLVGKHHLDDDRCSNLMVESVKFRQKARADRPLFPVFKLTHRLEPPTAPKDGYEHLSWCYYNKEQFSEIKRGLSLILSRDPGVSLLISIREGFKPFHELVSWLQRRHRKRHASFYRKVTMVERKQDDAATVEDADWLWDNVDYRVALSARLDKRDHVDWEDFKSLHAAKSFITEDYAFDTATREELVQATQARIDDFLARADSLLNTLNQAVAP